MHCLRYAKILLALFSFTLLCLATSRPGAAPPPPGRYTYLAVPGALGPGFTGASGINNRGQVVGFYYGQDNASHVYVYDRGVYTTLSLPAYAFPTGINNRGQIVGNLYGFIGFVYHEGVTTYLHVPGATTTIVNGINDRGQIAGWYTSGEDYLDHGFVYDNGVFTTIDAPNAFVTYIFGINDRGQVVGYYIDNDFTFLRGFVCDQSGFTDLFPPSAEFLSGQTFPSGINNRGEIAGNYNIEAVPDNLNQHGFLYYGGHFASFDAPDSGTGDYQGTLIHGINERGQIVGNSSNSNGHGHAFLLTR